MLQLKPGFPPPREDPDIERRLARIEEMMEEALPLLRQVATFLPGLKAVAKDKAW